MSSTSRRTAVPTPLLWVVVALVALAVVLAALPVVMAVNPDPFAASIARKDPTLRPAEVDFAVTVAVAFAAITHATYAMVVIWLVVKSLAGRRWARIGLTAAMILGMLSSVRSAQDGPEYYLAVIAGDVIFVAIAVLLWAPRSVRQFFVTHRAAAADTAETGPSSQHGTERTGRKPRTR